jgi:hypothetical protein
MSTEKEKKPRKTAPRKAANVEESVAATPKPKAAPKPRAAAKPKAAAAKAVETTEPAAVVVSETVTVERYFPTHQEIAQLAHRYYVERGWQHGFHEQDWLRAEQELGLR